MIRFPVHLQDDKTFLIESIPDRLVYQVFHYAGQNGVTVLCHEHHMVLQQEAAVAVRVIWLAFLFIVHMFAFSFTSVCLDDIIIAYKIMVGKEYIHERKAICDALRNHSLLGE